MVATKYEKPVIWAKGLSRIYSLGDTSVIGIYRIDLNVNHGELVVLKGNSGSGKSTLLSLLAGLDRPTHGIIRDYRTDGGVVFYELSQFQKDFKNPKWTGVRFFFRNPPRNPDAALSELRREIFQKCGDYIEIYSGNALREDILKIFDETFAVTTVLLLIALLVAALGITTTLTVLVLERSRQLNTLYAIGAEFQQIRSMIFWEAALMIVAGELGGLVCGFFISYLLVFVINKESFGWTFHYGVDWCALVMSLPLIFITALLSVLPAAQMVFREPPSTLLKE